MSLSDTDFPVSYGPADDPLHNFYLPALAASVQYDRSAGYFRSSALAAAAAGVARLIANDGYMRLLVGAELDEADVDALRNGYDLRERLAPGMLAALDNLEESLLRQRIEALAWLAANSSLDIRVVLPLDRHGRPIPGPAARDYYHVKEGIFTDAQGNQVSFVGSVNESEQAWQHNYETLQVSVTWESQREAQAVRNVRRRFDLLWEGKDAQWLAVELPDAVRQRLIRYAPASAPAFDPLEKREEETIRGVAADGYRAVSTEDRIRFQFLRDAPHLLDGGELGAATAAVHPWPHQLEVARSVLARFPDRVLLSDEVGLGKTVEAGLILRQLLLSGQVQRCLILTPAAVLKQWQEELYEKFNLAIPRYDDNRLFDHRGRPLGTRVIAPWADHPVLLASSHLARRRERVAEVLAAPAWDLLIVDEAHHARRRDFLQPQYRPNRLLTLLNSLRDKGRYRGLLLMTATPMQVHPVEVWDLLMTLGLSGRWAADEATFLAFFNQLRRGYDDVDWELVLGLVRDNLGATGTLDPHFVAGLRKAQGDALSSAICALPHASPAQQRDTVRALPPTARPALYDLARRHSPLRSYIYRNTRRLLRVYKQRGLIDANIPQRQPHIERIPFRPDEDVLYQRITEYITHFYQKYENERRGLGFVMTVYRRRLTSSFYAARRSLERRRDWLRGIVDPEEAVEQEDLWDLDDEMEEDEAIQTHLTPAQRQSFREELDYLDDFIGELRSLSQADSKLAFLKEQLERTFRQRDTVLIFTQYTDTLDYIRDHLKEVYGSAVACYSGRGGEEWNGLTWVVSSKEQVKNRFRLGEIKILLATESASEGLNLQTCGVLINYDMPWNPMRVEQRIGRIDRIDQRYEVIWIHNYFYAESIEDRIYQALADRIRWFEDVVGDLQPILAEVGETTRRLAMLPAEQQQAALQEAIAKLRASIESEQLSALGLDDVREELPTDNGRLSPVTLADMESILTGSPATAHLFTPHPALPDSWLLTGNDGPIPVTFAPDRFDEHPDSLHFLSYGSPLLDAILASVPPPESHDLAPTRLVADVPRPLVGWYDLRADLLRPLRSVGDLNRSLAYKADAQALPRSQADFQRRVEEERIRVAGRDAAFVERKRKTLAAQAQRLLVKAALVEIALGRQASLFDSDSYPRNFDEGAVQGLKRHKSPWSWMLIIASAPDLRPAQDDPFWAEVSPFSKERLRERFNNLTKEAAAVREQWRPLERKE